MVLRHITMGLVAVLAGTALVGSVAELTLRTVFSLGGICYGYDEQTLHRLIPGSAKVFVRPLDIGGGYVPVIINAHGFRGDAPEPASAANRIMVWGDSYIEAEFTRADQTFSEHLERRLARSSSRRFEVLNTSPSAVWSHA